MKVRIVSDSSSNIYAMDGVDFASAPLRISTTEKEYIDTADLDVAGMVDDLSSYKGRSSSACPGVGDYLAAFDGYDEIYCVTISGNLSGSYNAAMTAKQQYEEEHPDAKVFVLDSLSTGGEMRLLLEKIKEFVLKGTAFESICKELLEYQQHTSILFSLESVHNLANNGRVNPAIAKIVGLVGLRIIGDGKDGKLNPTDKCRGEKKAISTLFANMKKAGYKGGKLFIDHCLNEGGAVALKNLILSEFPNAIINIGKNGGLCSFYAERGGLIIGYEIS